MRSHHQLKYSGIQIHRRITRENFPQVRSQKIHLTMGTPSRAVRAYDELRYSGFQKIEF